MLTRTACWPEPPSHSPTHPSSGINQIHHEAMAWLRDTTCEDQWGKMRPKLPHAILPDTIRPAQPAAPPASWDLLEKRRRGVKRDERVCVVIRPDAMEWWFFAMRRFRSSEKT